MMFNIKKNVLQFPSRRQVGRETGMGRTGDGGDCLKGRTVVQPCNKTDESQTRLSQGLEMDSCTTLVMHVVQHKLYQES